MDASQHHFVSAQELAERFGGRVDGDPSVRIVRFASLSSAHFGDATFLSHPRFQEQLAHTRASLVILKDPALARQAGLGCTLIQSDDPYLFFAQAAGWLETRAREETVKETVIHGTACIDSSARIGRQVRIAAGAIIGAKVVIGDGSDIGAGCVIDQNCRIGASARLHARVTMAHDCIVGDRVVIHSGAVLGSDGFGYAPRPDRSWLKIPQVGGVVVGNDVEIGANTTIDRGTLDPTIIEDGVKLDNLIQVAHNVTIGRHTAIAGCVGIAGSARIGPYCQIGGAAGILGHLQIAEGCVIGPMSLVMSSITEPGKYVGVYPLQQQADWEKSAAIVRRLPELRRQLKQQGHQEN